MEKIIFDEIIFENFFEMFFDEEKFLETIFEEVFIEDFLHYFNLMPTTQYVPAIPTSLPSL